MMGYSKRHRQAIERVLRGVYGRFSGGTVFARKTDVSAERDIAAGRFIRLSRYPAVEELMTMKDFANPVLEKTVDKRERETV